MIKCKKCNNNQTVKNGFIRGSQRYKCSNCKYNFVDGDKRTNHSTEVKKALAVILYSSSKASFNFLGKLFGVNKSSVYKWINNVAKHIPEPSVSSSIKEMEFDEMWHFIGSKKTKNGSSKPWIVVQTELLHGLQAIVMLQPSESFMKK
jgi:transposase